MLVAWLSTMRKLYVMMQKATTNNSLIRNCKEAKAMRKMGKLKLKMKPRLMKVENN